MCDRSGYTFENVAFVPVGATAAIRGDVCRNGIKVGTFCWEPFRDIAVSDSSLGITVAEAHELFSQNRRRHNASCRAPAETKTRRTRPKRLVFGPTARCSQCDRERGQYADPSRWGSCPDCQRYFCWQHFTPGLGRCASCQTTRDDLERTSPRKCGKCGEMRLSDDPVYRSTRIPVLCRACRAALVWDSLIGQCSLRPHVAELPLAAYTVPVILIRSDGVVLFATTLSAKRDLVRLCRENPAQTRLIAVWPGQWRTDVFDVPLDAASASNL